MAVSYFVPFFLRQSTSLAAVMNSHSVTVPATSGAGVSPTARPSRASHVRVLILGHSFVKHLRNHLVASDFLNVGLLPTGHSVTLRSFSGLTYPGLLNKLKSVCAPGYQVVFIDFGTNDLAAGCAVELLVDMVWSVVETLRSCYGVRQMALMEMFPRAAGRYPCVPGFNYAARSYNDKLRERAAGVAGVYLCHPQGMVDNWRQYLRDGCHYNAAGMKKYVKSLRRAILKYSSPHLP